MVRECLVVTQCLFLVVVKCSVPNDVYGEDHTRDLSPQEIKGQQEDNLNHNGEHEGQPQDQEGKPQHFQEHRGQEIGGHHDYDENEDRNIGGDTKGDSQEQGETAVLTEEHEALLTEVDSNITHIKNKLGRIYSQNSAMLHKLAKLDDYIKRGGDMETRFVIEILGYPFDSGVVSPEEFLEHLAVAFNLNFTHKQITGLRIMAGRGASDTRLAVEFACAKHKKAWLKAYKQRLYQISWGDAEKAFGASKESYKYLHHKTVYLQDFLPTICEMYGAGVVRFAVNDYISPYRKRLLSYAKLLAAHYKWRFVWVSDGDIFIRKKNSERGYYVRAEKDFRAFDWRLENEDFFWKVINECNSERRDMMRRTTKRVLPWMTTRDWDETGHNRHYRKSLLNYKRGFDDQLRDLLDQVTTIGNLDEGANKYNFLTVQLNLNRTAKSTIPQRNWI
uniref:FP protein C-terminal domain-containing protein n=1 Tax=Cacopsylla melanoneura TaxID=428564 RepID=A0A8D8PTP6_9HEMI